MATLLTKGLIIAGGLAGASATGGGIYYLTSNNSTKQDIIENKETSDTQDSLQPKTITKDKSISSLLNGKVLLTKGREDDGKSDAPWKLFVAANKSEAPKDPWVFAEWKKDGKEVESLDSFKTQCIALAKKQVSGVEDNIYIQVEKYCTTEKAKQAGDV